MRERRRPLLLTVLAIGLVTVLCGTHLSRVYAPAWTPVQHAIVDSGGQLLSLAAFLVLALNLEKQRDGQRRRPDSRHDSSSSS